MVYVVTLEYIITNQPIEWINASSVHTDKKFVVTWLRAKNVFNRQCICATEFRELSRLHTVPAQSSLLAQQSVVPTDIHKYAATPAQVMNLSSVCGNSVASGISVSAEFKQGNISEAKYMRLADAPISAEVAHVSITVIRG
jgi:hypothetical protein